MTRITVLVSLLLLSTAACTSEVITEETTEAAVSGLSKKDALAAFEKVIECKPGDKSFAKDRCNTCVCAEGVWACTKKRCDVDDADDQVAECKKGQVKKAGDGCNTCSCNGGAWACTLKLCVEEEDVDDSAVCKDGAVVPAKDGCNTCSCVDGGWACTKKGCGAPPKKKPLK